MCTVQFRARIACRMRKIMKNSIHLYFGNEEYITIVLSFETVTISRGETEGDSHG